MKKRIFGNQFVYYLAIFCSALVVLMYIIIASTKVYFEDGKMPAKLLIDFVINNSILILMGCSLLLLQMFLIKFYRFRGGISDEIEKIGT